MDTESQAKSIVSRALVNTLRAILCIAPGAVAIIWRYGGLSFSGWFLLWLIGVPCVVFLLFLLSESLGLVLRPVVVDVLFKVLLGLGLVVAILCLVSYLNSH
jgi:hypothetical protein